MDSVGNCSKEEKEIKSGVYKITNTRTKKIYIGSTINLKLRWCNHIQTLRKNNHKNKYLQNSFNKYGEEFFQFNVIEYVGEKYKLLEREQYWMDKLHVCDDNIGYNISPTAGNTLGVKLSEETKIKMSKIRKGKKFSEEHKRNLSEAGKGRIVTEETKNKIGKANKGKKRSDEAIIKLALINTGKKRSDETKKKMSLAGKGRVVSEETRKKISRTKRQGINPIAILTINDVIEIKKLAKQRVKSKDISKLFNISVGTVNSIKYNITWAYIKLENYINKTELELLECIGQENNRKLSDDQVREVRKMLQQGISQKDIAEKFNVFANTISNIKNNKLYKYVTIDEITNEELKAITRDYIGENNPAAKLTEKQVIEIKEMLLKGISGKKIAIIYNVGATTIYSIRSGKSWSHINLEDYLDENDNLKDIL